VSTPTSLDLPEGTRPGTVVTARGTFAVLDALPDAGPCERGTALLVLRGQYQTPGPDDADAYDPAELGADIAAIATATQATHLLGHSFGGLVAREAVLGGYAPASLTLLSSGPGALTGPRAEELHSMLGFLDSVPPPQLRERLAEIWHGKLKPQAVAAGVSAPMVAFLQERMLANNPTGLVTMAMQLLKAEDKTSDLAARHIPTFVLYGEDDNAWPTAQQRDMAVRLDAERSCIPAAAHNPNVEAPATTAHALTMFWNAAEG
jgi:pimeloyl-ACP methyl ester carboxylesterase